MVDKYVEAWFSRYPSPDGHRVLECKECQLLLPLEFVQIGPGGDFMVEHAVNRDAQNLNIGIDRINYG